MGTDRLLLILQAAAGVITGGGVLKLLDLWFKGRAEARKLKTSSDVDTSTAATNLITQLQADGAVLREQMKDFQTKYERLEDRHLQEMRGLTEQLRTAHMENTRLATRVAQLINDLDVANRQISDLRNRLP